MTELEAYKDLIDCCFTVRSNMNDAFYWATADVGHIEADDIAKIIPIYQQCGHVTLVAYEAIVRGHDPTPSLLSHYKDKGVSYWKAKKLLEPLAATGTILWERWDQLEEDKRDVAFFGSKITWSNSYGETTHHKFKYVIQKAQLANGMWSIGTSIDQARTRLTKKYLLKVKGIKDVQA